MSTLKIKKEKSAKTTASKTIGKVENVGHIIWEETFH
jgi:hypothetical protein